MVIALGRDIEETAEREDAESDLLASGRGRALIAAYEAALSVASEVDLPVVLQRIVDLARALVSARYGALGVADDDGHILDFITSGISAEEREAIGPIPQGHGMLGELISKREPMLVPNIAAHPRSVGFPTHHPAMTTLLGVPILLGSRALGNLYLTEREDGQPFDERDLEVVQVLAAHAATAIDHAHLYQQVAAARLQAEEQRDQLRTILDNLPAGVLIQAPPNGAIELANSAALGLLLGASHPGGTLPIAGRDYRFLQSDGTPLPNDQRPGLRALRGETIRSKQFLVERWDGQRLPVLAQAGPLRDARGDIVRAVVVLQDITRLREAEQLKDDFLSLVSHELRTPVTSIYGGAHLLAHQGDRLDAATRDELLTDVVAESERLDQMLSNLLGLAAIQAGRLDPTTEPVLIEPLALKVAREVGAHTVRHSFAVAIPPDIPPVEADPALLEQVLQNLYENAVKYSPEGGEIRTTATRAGNRVAIHVTDQGVGIAPEHVGEVFDRFRRPGAPLSVRGMGLGLYLSRSLVEAQDGSISATSAGLGTGATFTVNLPIAQGWDTNIE